MTTSECQRRFGDLLDRLRRTGRVELTQHGRLVAVVTLPEHELGARANAVADRPAADRPSMDPPVVRSAPDLFWPPWNDPDYADVRQAWDEMGEAAVDEMLAPIDATGFKRDLGE